MHLPHFLAWVEVLWHHAHNDTLPPVPTGNVPVTVPPIDTTKSAPSMGVTVAPLALGVANTGFDVAGRPVPVPVSDVSVVSGVAADHGHVGTDSNGVVLPAGCVPTGNPNMPGTVTMPALAGTGLDGWALAFEELAKCYPEGSDERNFLEANIFVANGMEIIEEQEAFFPALKPLIAGSNPPAVNTKAKAFLKSCALPALDRGDGKALPTAASILAHYGK